MQMHEKVGKSRNTVFFQWFVAPEGRKVGSLKRRVRSQLARWEIKNCTPLWREAHFQVKRYKTHHCRTTFGSWDVEKVHAVVARSTFRSQNVQNTIVGPLLEVEMSKKCTPLWREAHFEVKMYNVQNTPGSDHFWKLRCRKSARRCGPKHISKSKCTKHRMFAPLLEVQMSKKCTPLWGEAHFEVKMYKPHQGFGPLLEVQMSLGFASLRYTPLHSTLHSTTLHYITLHYTTLHYTTWHYTPLHYITLHYTTFHYTSLHYTTLHSTTLQLHLRLHNYTLLHSTTRDYTTLHYITLHYTTFHYSPLHFTTLHYTTLLWMTLRHR